MCLKIKLIITLLLCLSEVKPARILGVFPIPSKSHHIAFRGYTQELARRGHELVLITPDPSLNSRPNVTEIDVSFAYKRAMEMFQAASPLLKRGVIMDIDVIIEADFFKMILDIVAEEFKHPEVMKLIKSKDQHFDLIVVEGFYDYQLIFSKIFKAPVIMMATFMGFNEHYDMMGSASAHPVLYPNFNRMYYDNLNTWEFLREVYYEVKMIQLFHNIEKHQDQLLKKNFGPEAPTTKELRKNVDMLFLTVHPMFANNRPVPPNVIYLGATHLGQIKTLPEDLKSYLDNSTRGVVYVSLGTNVHPSMMHKDLLDAFLNAFEALPYNILWKFDGDNIKLSKNVKIQKWFPQRNLLFHPNIKAFVTQCGIQSTSEAIDAAVPLVGVPMMAEQGFNAKKIVDFGIGVKLDSLTLTADNLINGIETVIENASYKQNARRISKIIKDEPQSPLERAAWWTEYVLRHRGAKHLKSPAANLTWSEYFELNLILTLSGCVLLGVSVFLFILCKLYKIVKRLLNKINNRKINKEKVK